MKKTTKKAERRYRMLVEWSEDDGVFVARAPSFPYVAAHGETEVEAIRELGLAVDGALELLRESRAALPPTEAASSFSGQVRLRMPASFHRLLSAMAEFERVSLNTLMVELLAEAAGWRSARRSAPDAGGAMLVSESPARYLVAPLARKRRRHTRTERARRR